MRKSFGSIRDVTRETGLSIATISRVMNGATNVGKRTRELVLEACERLDYLLNPAARAVHQHVEDEEFKAARKLLGMGAQAYILSGSCHRADLLDMFGRRRVFYVFTSVWDADAGHPTIGYDNAHLAAEGVRFLVERGHRDIAVIHGPLSESDRTRTRKEGAESMAKAAKLSFYETSLSVHGGRVAVQEMLRSQSNTTALLCFSDVLALGAHFQLMNAGKRIPDDISVMGFDNLDWAIDAEPALTTIDLPAGDMGRAVAEQMIIVLEGGALLHRQLLPARIIERSSVGKIN